MHNYEVIANVGKKKKDVNVLSNCCLSNQTRAKGIANACRFRKNNYQLNTSDQPECHGFALSLRKNSANHHYNATILCHGTNAHKWHMY